MASINTGRVVTGGLAAGVVANLLDMTWNFTVLKEDLVVVGQRLGLDAAAATSLSSAVPWIVVDFILGLVAVWTYAAMRPRFGPGPKTAILAALVPWLAASAVVFGFTSLGLMPTGAFVRGTIAAFVTMTVSTLAGAWLYAEADGHAAVRAA